MLQNRSYDGDITFLETGVSKFQQSTPHVRGLARWPLVARRVRHVLDSLIIRFHKLLQFVFMNDTSITETSSLLPISQPSISKQQMSRSRIFKTSAREPLTQHPHAKLRTDSVRGPLSWLNPTRARFDIFPKGTAWQDGGSDSEVRHVGERPSMPANAQVVRILMGRTLPSVLDRIAAAAKTVLCFGPIVESESLADPSTRRI